MTLRSTVKTIFQMNKQRSSSAIRQTRKLTAVKIAECFNRPTKSAEQNASSSKQQVNEFAIVKAIMCAS